MNSNTFASYFNSEYMPHGHCYLWQPHILWMNVLSDALIALAYFSIPIAILIFIKKRPDIGYQKVFGLFAVFIMLCGITHVIGIVTVWQGIYGWHGIVKALTATVSIITAAYLFKILPKSYFFSTPEQVDGIKKQLNTANELVRMKEQLLESHRKLQRAVNATEDGIWEIELASNVLYCSDKFSELISQESTGTVTLSSWKSHVHPSHLEQFNETLTSVFSQKERFSFEYLGLSPSGDYGWFTLTGKVFFNDNNEPELATGSLRYTHKTKVLKESITERDELLNAIYEGANNSIWVIAVEPESEFRFLTFNRTASERLGVPAENVIGRTLSDLKKRDLPSGLAEKMEGFYQSCVDTNDSVEFDIQMPFQGKLYWYHVSLYPIVNSEDNVIKIVGSSIDISSLKQAEQALSDSKQQLEKILDASVCGVKLFDVKTQRTVRVNRRYTELLGYSKQDIKSQFQNLERYHPDDIAKINDHFELVLQSQDNDLFSIQYRYKHKDGRWIWCNTYSTIIQRDRENNPLTLLTTFIDVTESITLMEKLKESNLYLERFALVASHDLQEPLRKIQSFCGLLSTRLEEQCQLDDDSKYQFHTIEDAAKRMKIMIADIMGLSKVNSTPINRRECTLEELVNMATDQLQLSIEESNAEIKIVNHSFIAFVDRSMIAQLLQNLIANSIKFKGEKTPLIEISAEKIESWTKLFVKDNGIGMEEEFCEQIFEPFRRLHSKDKYQGSGIGLAICRQICKAHDGDISCTSEVGVGATFVIEIRSK